MDRDARPEREPPRTVRPPGRPVAFRRYISTLLGQANLPLALGAFLLGLLGNVLAGVLGGWQALGIPSEWLILIVLAVAVVALYIYHRRRTERPVIEMRQARPTGKAGLILLLSTLDPRARGTKAEAKRRREEVQAAVAHISSAAEAELSEADFAPLLGTNLEPALRAIEFHHRAGTLRECWTIGTPDEMGQDGIPHAGSARLGLVLQRWFSHCHPGHKVLFHPAIAVPARDYVTLWDQVDAIFRGGPLREEAIICDVTGGLKLMSIGAALACLAEGRTMQYMATDRDWKGEPLPAGEMQPVLLDISPYLV